MKQYIDTLKKHLVEHPPNYGYHNAYCLLDMLCSCYMESNHADSASIRQAFAELDLHLEQLPLKENDAIFDVVCDLCTEHQRLAFIAGVQVGMRLFSELECGTGNV